MENINLNNYLPTIGEIVAGDYRSAEVFRKFGIDYCCKGSLTLQEACEAAGTSLEVVEENYYRELSKLNGEEAHDFWNWETGFLADYIVNTHHYFVKQHIVLLNVLAQETVTQHGKDFPELCELAERISYFLRNLEDQMQREEELLFPMIKKLALARKKKSSGINIGELTPLVLSLFAEMESEHLATGDELKFYRALTRDYSLPSDIYALYNYLFARLQDLENDLVQHVHLENNILFPKVLLLGNSLLNKHTAQA